MSEYADRKVLVSPEVMEQWLIRCHARDSEGRLLTWKWGEADTDGFYNPTITSHDDDRLGELDAAWAEAEAAAAASTDLRGHEHGHWTLTDVVKRAVDGPRAWRAIAVLTRPPGAIWTDTKQAGVGPTPAAALTALAAVLRERSA